MLLRMTPIPSLANWDFAGPLPEVLGVSVLVSTLLALFVIHRVSMKRGLFPSAGPRTSSVTRIRAFGVNNVPRNDSRIYPRRPPGQSSKILPKDHMIRQPQILLHIIKMPNKPMFFCC